MGVYLNPSNDNFLEILRMPIFVDKTMILSVINRFIDQCNKYICVARPRRFGKTIAANILAAYYSKGCDSKEVFEKLAFGKEPSFESKLNKYNVIKIDLNAELTNAEIRENALKNLIKKLKKEIREEFNTLEFEDYETLSDYILKVYQNTGEQFIILIDEYDVFVREQVNDRITTATFDEYLNFLNGLFKNDTLKPAIALAYFTGILPIVRDKIQSKLNNFHEYTMLSMQELTEFTGFTEEEVIKLCAKNKINFTECKRWYDGYKLSKTIIDENNDAHDEFFDIYNPRSVVAALESRKFENYWTQTSSYQVITEKLNLNFDGTKDAVIKILSGENVYADPKSYLNTMTDFNCFNDVVGYLVHLGYLSYNQTEQTICIPNSEIAQEWQRAINICDEYKVTNGIIKHSKELLESTFECDEKAVAEALDTAHIHVTSNRSYNNEDALQSAIYLSYMYALNKYTIIREMTAGKGFADVTFVPYVPNIPAMIIELKHNKDPRTALDQIKEKKYFDSLSQYSGDILFVGINYDEETKTHTCKIEKYIK